MSNSDRSIMLSEKHELWCCISQNDPSTTIHLEDSVPFLIVEVKGFKDINHDKTCDSFYVPLLCTLYAFYGYETSIKSFGEMDAENFLSHFYSTAKAISTCNAYLRLHFHLFYYKDKSAKAIPVIRWLRDLCTEVSDVCHSIYKGEFPDAPFMQHFTITEIDEQSFLKKIDCKFDPQALEVKFQLCSV